MYIYVVRRLHDTGSTESGSSAASDMYKREALRSHELWRIALKVHFQTVPDDLLVELGTPPVKRT